MNREDILKQAITTVTADLAVNYGEPEDSFGLIAAFWSSYLNTVLKVPVTIQPSDVAAMMGLLKVARIAGIHSAENPSHKALMDSWLALAGYAGCGGESDFNIGES